MNALTDRTSDTALLARETEESDVMGLVINAELTQAERDALVTAWLLHLWWELSKGNYRRNTAHDGELCR